MDNNMITNKTNEKIFSADNTFSNEQITQFLYYFFDEVVKRKRRKVYNGGLQAGLAVSKTAFAAKINEDDGKSSHLSTSINLTKYLNGDDFYITEKGLGNTSLYRHAYNELFTSCIDSRIVAGDRELLMSFISNRGELSYFQVGLLRAIADSCKLLIDNGILDNVSIGVRVGNIDFKIDNWDDEHYKELCDKIDSEAKGTQKTKKY